MQEAVIILDDDGFSLCYAVTGMPFTCFIIYLYV